MNAYDKTAGSPDGGKTLPKQKHGKEGEKPGASGCKEGEPPSFWTKVIRHVLSPQHGRIDMYLVSGISVWHAKLRMEILVVTFNKQNHSRRLIAKY